MDHFYRKIQGWSQFIQHYEDAVKAAPKTGAHFVEVGAWKGKSAAFMAVEIANSGKDIKFTVVDWFKGSDERKHREDPVIQQDRLYETFMENIKPVKHLIDVRRGMSTDVAKQFADESLDFILLDASHDYLNVRADLYAWWPKLKPHGVMVGDDYKWIGVRDAVTEFFRKDPAAEPLGRCWKVVK